MRGIKFRAWIKPLNKMVEVQSITFRPSIYCKNGYIEYAELDILNPRGSITVPMDDVFLMQYTGLKDKNGKEIYEGDIYRSFWCVNVNHALSNAYLDGNTNVTGLGFNKLNAERFFEVIGNIYENPELEKSLNQFYVPLLPRPQLLEGK